MEQKSHLLLSEQLCFPIYATSRMITRLYQPYLQAIDLTYPQYLVMLVLWENNPLLVGELSTKLYLNTNTITPIIKKLVEKGFVKKTRSASDERNVFVELSKEGELLKNRAETIPLNLVQSIDFDSSELLQMRTLMWKFLSTFNTSDEN